MELILRTTQIRSISLAAIALGLLFLLLQSHHGGTAGLGQTTRQSLHAISQLAPDAWRHGSVVTKVTGLYGSQNELFEAGIRSHEEHNTKHGYDMQVIRQEVVNLYTTMPMYLLSLIVTELAKTTERRTQWLMWFGPDVMILNPQIPVETFLPPNDFAAGHLLGTHGPDGFDSSIFFVRVHEWSVKLLLEVINMPLSYPGIGLHKAFEMVLSSDRYRSAVLYQPRMWYNAYQVNVSHFDGEPGTLAVHFPDIGGDKWSAMADFIARPAESKKKWSIALEQTRYEGEVRDYWQRIREAYDLLKEAQPRIGDKAIAEAHRRLQYAVTYEMDRIEKIGPALHSVQRALGMQVDD